MKQSTKRSLWISGLLLLFFTVVAVAIQLLRPGGWFSEQNIEKIYIVTSVDAKENTAMAVIPSSDSEGRNNIVLTDVSKQKCQIQPGTNIWVERGIYELMIFNWKALDWTCKIDDSMTQR